jgi:hypothetical protein
VKAGETAVLPNQKRPWILLRGAIRNITEVTETIGNGEMARGGTGRGVEPVITETDVGIGIGTGPGHGLPRGTEKDRGVTGIDTGRGVASDIIGTATQMNEHALIPASDVGGTGVGRRMSDTIRRESGRHMRDRRGKAAPR